MKGFFKILVVGLILMAFGMNVHAAIADNDDGIRCEQSSVCQPSQLHVSDAVATLILAPADHYMPIVAPDPDTPEAPCLLLSKFKMRPAPGFGNYDTSQSTWRQSIPSTITPSQLPRPPSME